MFRRIAVGVIAVAGVWLAGASLAPTQVSAKAADDGYGIGYVGSTRYEMRNYSQTVAFLNAYCSRVGTGVMVAGYPTNTNFNDTTGHLTYTANVVWRSCGPVNDTRAFAITGYPASEPGSLATCPNAGQYAYEIGTYDCIKYTGSDAGHLNGYATLNCNAGTGYQCVTGRSSPSGLFRSSIERLDRAPPSSPSRAAVPGMYGDVPFWSSAGQTSGNYGFNRPGAFCTYWKRNSNGSSAYGGCVGLAINVSWVRANYSLTPTITNVPAGLNGQAIASEAGPRTVTGRVTNNGPTSSNPNTDWQLTELIYQPGASIPSRPAASSTSSPCDYFRAPSGYSCDESNTPASTVTKGTESGRYAYPNNNTYNRSSNIGAEPAGTRICYAMSVRPRAHNSNNWQHSGLHCYVISKMPKVQIWGGDLIAGRGTIVNTPGIRTSITTLGASNTTYGSWGEYALSSRGVVVGMASGSGFQGGSSSPDICTNALSLLTFNNTSTSGVCATGRYGNTAASPAGAVVQYFGRMASQNNGAATVNVQSLTANSVQRLTNGSSTIRLIAPNDIPAGKWVAIYAPDKTIIIDSDIRYTNGAISNPAQSPQLVIIANRIVVADAVSNVDAWLVTTGSGNGVNTCGVGGTNETANPLAGVCNNRLQVNGPVMTDQLLLRRTFGSEPGAAGEPAEVFNLRPDAYLWMTSLQGAHKVPTVSSKELPPRF